MDVLGTERRTLREEAVDVVKHALLDGRMQAGEIYSANALAARLGISNSPAREAMMDLAAQGLLEVVRNRGFRVRSLTREDQREIYQMRCVLEVAAFRILAGRGLSSTEQTEARRLCEHTLDVMAGDAEAGSVEFLDADHAFHMYLYSLIGNVRMSEAIGNLRDQARVCGAFVDADAQEMAHCAEEHRSFITALTEQDVERAAALMRRHLDYAKPAELSADCGAAAPAQP